MSRHVVDTSGAPSAHPRAGRGRQGAHVSKDVSTGNLVGDHSVAIIAVSYGRRETSGRDAAT